MEARECGVDGKKGNRGTVIILSNQGGLAVTLNFIREVSTAKKSSSPQQLGSGANAGARDEMAQWMFVYVQVGALDEMSKSVTGHCENVTASTAGPIPDVASSVIFPSVPPRLGLLLPCFLIIGSVSIFAFPSST